MTATRQAQQARLLEAPMPVRSILNAMDAHRERMIAIQSEAYPDHWSAAERREMAEQHLFGGSNERG
jgi:hypothetical protein